MKKYLSLLMLLMFSTAWADTVELKIENNQTVIVDLAHSQCISQLKTVHVRGMVIELEDGSLWEIEELGPETKSFYAPQGESLPFDFAEEWVVQWQPGEKLIFHKMSDREPLLIYNIDKNHLFDFSPFLPPIEPSLYVVKFDEINKVVVLSDHSVWGFNNFSGSQEWSFGDPIVVAKNSVLDSTSSYVLLNLCACFCDATVEHIHPNRLDVNRIDES
jgi:hypothetical protein